MALGGGTFVTQNKVLPGSYMNFVSAKRATANLSDRGIVAMPFVSDWGKEGEVIEITQEKFQKEALKMLGYSYTHKNNMAFREVFRNATKIYAYRLNSGTTKATNTYATAVYGGTRGNKISIAIQTNIDNSSKFDVKTMIDNEVVDTQTVTNASELVANDFVTFKAEAQLTQTPNTPLTGGGNGTGKTGENYKKFLEKIEPYSFNALCCNTDEQDIINLFVAFTKRMRDAMGVKFQTVAYRAENTDYEGVVSVENNLLNTQEEYGLVYWVTGLIAGCAVNKSCLNSIYDGEYTVNTDYTQTQLEEAIQNGKFMLHKVGDDVRVLEDINTLVTITEEKGEIFKDNQTVRVIDQIATDIATLFNTKYLGIIPNDASGRMSLWTDIVKHHQELQDMRAIEDFTDEDVTVKQGDTKKSVVVTDAITVTNTMAKLYMTVTVG